MKKIPDHLIAIIFPLILLTAFNNKAAAQNIEMPKTKNQLKLGMGPAFLTSGDYGAFSFYSQYNRRISNKMEISSEFNFLHGTSDWVSIGDTSVWKYPFSLISKENPETPLPLTPSYELSGENAYFKKLPTNLNRQTHIGGDIGLNYYALNSERHKLKAGLGFSISYIDITYEIGPESGVFTNEALGISSQITILVPFYDRYVEGRWVMKIDYEYKLNDTLSLGIGGRGWFYLDEFVAETWATHISAGVGF